MNIFQRFMIRLGWEFVLLETVSGVVVRRAYWVGNKLFANPYLPETRTELLPGGKIGIGKSYVWRWFSITKRTEDYYRGS